MKLKITPDIKDNVYSTNITVSSLGNQSLAPEEEAVMLANFPTYIQYKDINFVDKYTVDGSGKIVKDSEGDEVKVSMINAKKLVDATFTAHFEVATSSIVVPSTNTSLTTKELIADAMCRLFEDKIQEAVTNVLVGIRDKNKDDFETRDEVII